MVAYHKLTTPTIPGIEGKLGVIVIMDGCMGGGGPRILEGAFNEGSSGLYPASTKGESCTHILSMGSDQLQYLNER